VFLCIEQSHGKVTVKTAFRNRTRSGHSGAAAAAPGDSLSNVESAGRPTEGSSKPPAPDFNGPQGSGNPQGSNGPQGLDEESAGWLRRLRAGDAERQAAERELHARLVRIALAEVRRRSASTAVTGQELDDVAHQAAGDAMVAVLAKLDEFRGESRFLTWAYRFVILEVSSKLGRHFWRHPAVALDAGQWERLPDRLGLDPERQAAAAGMLAEVRRVVDTELTAHQRRLFVAVIVDGIPLDAVAAKLGMRRNAIYKAVFDTRRKIRRALVAKGYLDEPDAGQR